jgi:hypothetical protein
MQKNLDLLKYKAIKEKIEKNLDELAAAKE